MRGERGSLPPRALFSPKEDGAGGLVAAEQAVPPRGRLRRCREPRGPEESPLRLVLRVLRHLAGWGQVIKLGQVGGLGGWIAIGCDWRVG